jgi:hypothetical protein
MTEICRGKRAGLSGNRLMLVQRTHRMVSPNPREPL